MRSFALAFVGSLAALALSACTSAMSGSLGDAGRCIEEASTSAIAAGRGTPLDYVLGGVGGLLAAFLGGRAVKKVARKETEAWDRETVLTPTDAAELNAANAALKESAKP
jgi:hypothetical protein